MFKLVSFRNLDFLKCPKCPFGFGDKIPDSFFGLPLLRWMLLKLHVLKLLGLLSVVSLGLNMDFERAF